MSRSRTLAVVLALVAAVLLAGSLVWRAAFVPLVVRYPTNLDETLHYEGTLSVFVDPQTLLPVTTPISAPLRIDRRIEALGSESGAHRVVVRERLHLRAGTLLDRVLTSVYVMDRRSMRNVRDPRAYAFTPDNVVDRSPAYRINLPLDTQRRPYAIYKNEIATTYEIVPDTEHPTERRAGLELDRFVASSAPKPLSAAYLAELRRVVPLPAGLTLDRLDPILRAAGIDVRAALAALLPVLSPTDLSTVTALAASVVPLEYTLSLDGVVGIEPDTGAEVRVQATETTGARPDPAQLRPLQQLLARYQGVPAADAAARVVTALVSGPPLRLLEMRYDETPASVERAAHEARKFRDRRRLAETTVPAALVAGGVVLALAAAAVALRARPPAPTT